jgi:hypothetical protein
VAATKLTAPNGATVSVDSGRVDNLLRRGFTKASETKTPAKKAAPKKSSKS